MKKFMLTFVSMMLTAGFATAATVPIAASTDNMDYGVVAGAFAKKPKKVVAGGVTYYIIAPDLIEPACNSTQIVVWVDDHTLEGDQGGVAYNLGVQANAFVSAVADGAEVKVTYRVNDVSDCSKSAPTTVYLKYTGSGNALEVRK